eukprot:SAG11_NODE_24918_length_366_cov_0.677903_1_plen_103_part_10
MNGARAADRVSVVELAHRLLVRKLGPVVHMVASPEMHRMCRRLSRQKFELRAGWRHCKRSRTTRDRLQRGQQRSLGRNIVTALSFHLHGVEVGTNGRTLGASQ